MSTENDQDWPAVATLVASNDNLRARIAALLDLIRQTDIAIDKIHAAFGAPGDYGYESREGKALFGLYCLRAGLLKKAEEK